MSERINKNPNIEKEQSDRHRVSKLILKRATIAAVSVGLGFGLASRESPNKKTEVPPEDNRPMVFSQGSNYQDRLNESTNEFVIGYEMYSFGELTPYTVKEGDNGIWGIVKNTYGLTNEKHIQAIVGHLESLPDNADLLEKNDNRLFPDDTLSIYESVSVNGESSKTEDTSTDTNEEPRTGIEDSDDVKTPPWVIEDYENLKSGDKDTNPDI